MTDILIQSRGRLQSSKAINRRPPAGRSHLSIASRSLPALIVCLGLAGCSLPKQDANAGEPVSRTFYSSVTAVCDLLKAADLESKTGFRYSDGSDLPTFAFGALTPSTKCIYVPVEGLAPGRGTVVTAVVYAYAEDVLETQKQRFKGIGIDNVRDLGDEAFWLPAADELYILTEGKLFGVHVPSGGHEPDEHLKERSQRLAVKALERLR